MRILITGGTGFIGGVLCDRLIASGHEVNVLTRDPEKARDSLVPGAHAVAWNPSDSGDQCQLPAGTDAVINLAGESIASGRWTASKRQRIRDSRIAATRWIVTAIRAAETRPSVLINASAIGLYGNRGEEILTEASPAGNGFLARVVEEWEGAASEVNKLDVRLVLLRLGVVIGPGGGALPQMAMPFRLFAGGPLGDGQQWLSWIHRDDVVGMILWALTEESAHGPINAVAPEPIRNKDFSRELGKALNRPSWIPAPAFALRILLGGMADGLLLGSQRVVPEVPLQRGFTFQFPDASAALSDSLR